MRPPQQRLRELGEQKIQQYWIVFHLLDSAVELWQLKWTGDGFLYISNESDIVCYEALWTYLSKLDCDRKVHWITGWGSRRLLESARWLDALRVGQIELPTTTDKSGAVKHTGRLSLSSKICEVDLLAGKNKYKIVDLAQWHLNRTDYEGTDRDKYESPAIAALYDWLYTGQTFGWGTTQTTAPRQGWQWFMRGSYKYTMHTCIDASARALERRAYFGGRNECFRLGPIPGVTFNVDIKSCYAYICSRDWLPILLDDVADRHYYDYSDDRSKSIQYAADVLIDTDEPDYPCRHGEDTIYPVGQFVTSLCWPELQHALRRQRVKRVFRSHRYLCAPALSRFARCLQQAKDTIADGQHYVPASTLKAVWNAGIGYTARYLYEWRDCPSPMGHDYYLGIGPHSELPGKYTHYKIVDKRAAYLNKTGESEYAMPVLHAWISSAARMLLLWFMETLDKQECWYCDTDGLLISERAYDFAVKHCMIGGSHLGALVRRSDPGPATIYGCKSYRLGDYVIASGALKKDRFKVPHVKNYVYSGGVTLDTGYTRPYNATIETNPHAVYGISNVIS